MKRKNIQNSNGISISDSIVMSVKQKHTNSRKLYSSIIAFIGFISVIMAFLGMFHINYSKKTVVLSGIVILTFYIAVSVIGGKALWLYGASVFLFLFSVFKFYTEKVPDKFSENKEISKLILGFRYIYNVIYNVAIDPNTSNHYKVEAANEIYFVTSFFILYMWLLAIVICFFTICRPNPVFPILVTFPIIEIGLFYGVKMPVFWGILCIAYWLAVMAMSTIDVGEYSGGQSGFVRKNNLFFPKRHMKLKVTEKCGMIVVCSVMLIAFISSGIIKLTHYERSESINQKRRDISDAADDFSFGNLGESIIRIINAFGANFDYESYKLGTCGKIKYKNVTDLTVTLEKPVSRTLYLKYEVRSLYKDNEWFKLPSNEYNDSIFDDFKRFGVYPQDFTFNNYSLMDPEYNTNFIKIKPGKRKKGNIYVPYFTENNEPMKYINDTLKIPFDSKKEGNGYYFCSDDVVRNIYKFNSVNQSTLYFDSIYNNSNYQKYVSKYKSIEEYCKSNGLIFDEDYVIVRYLGSGNENDVKSNPDSVITRLLQDKYKDFACGIYCKVPDNDAMNQVHDLYSDIVDNQDISTAVNELNVLEAIKNKLAENDYSLEPGITPSNVDFVNDFLLYRKKGYCVHFATAGVMLARMAGIPARYAIGYVVVEDEVKNGKVNSDGSITVNVKDNRSHAWAEVYLENVGWVPYEFTPGYYNVPNNQSTDQSTTITNTQTTHNPLNTTTTSASSTAFSSQISSTQISTSYVYSSGENGKQDVTTLKVWLAPYLKTLKILVKFIMYCILVFFILIIRRYVILKIRKQQLTTGKATERVINIYSYAEKLLNEMNMRSEMSNYISFAEEVERYHGSIYFDKGGFRNLTDIALKTRFSESVPNNEDVKECLKFVDQLSNNLYNKSSRLRKIMIRYIKVLR